MVKRVILSLICLSAICTADSKKDAKPNLTELKETYLKESKFWPKPEVVGNVTWREIHALPKEIPAPKDNPFSTQKAELGKKLFLDPRLSKSNQIACASCHDPDLAYGDGKRVSHGHDRQTGKRNAPNITMAAFGVEKFWDGRAKDLETQALMPIQDPVEMAIHPEIVAEKLNNIQEYKDAFKQVFNTDIITTELIAKAIATYERTLFTSVQNTRFERFLNGNANALDEEEVWGFHVFRTKAKCMTCHHGPELSDHKYHNLGLTYYQRHYEDLGRYNVTGNPKDIGTFKTPTLRRIGKSEPYMHNGLFPSLRGVLNAYNFGMFHPRPTEAQKDDPLYPKTSPLVQPINLSKEELDALEAFLLTL